MYSLVAFLFELCVTMGCSVLSVSKLLLCSAFTHFGHFLEILRALGVVRFGAAHEAGG